jgi:putative transposase
VAGCHRRRFRTTRRDPARPSAPDLVQRTFSASTPNQVWVADLTYVPTQQGFLFLAVVLDACSRRVVGWSMAAHLRTALVVAALDMAALVVAALDMAALVVAALDMAALDMALQHRRPLVGVIHHSDHGSQYTSAAFQERCRQLGVRSSMGSVGDCYDNALAESFVATLECELLARTAFRTHVEARTALFDYIEIFYNRQRRHSTLGSLSPEGFERRLLGTLVVASSFTVHQTGATSLDEESDAVLGNRQTSESTPAEERSAQVYRWGKRLSGVTWSPGGAISLVQVR